MTDTECAPCEPALTSLGPAVASSSDGRAQAQRRTLIGLLTVVTAVAFEGLAVATVMPVVARALHGLSLYGWAFTGFLITSIVGMVAAGAVADRRGPRLPYLAGLAAFAVGLVVAGSARSMPVFVLGRAIQGVGAGANIVSLYVVVARVYREDQRPRVFAAVSGAWVLPSIVGPALGGFVADHLGWRWVFFGLPPFVAAGLALIAPALRTLPEADSVAQPRPGHGLRAVATACGVAALEAAAQQAQVWRVWSVALGLAGAALLVWGLRGLLPAGSLRLARGLPMVVVSRGLLAGAFFGAEAFVPLDLQSVHHLRPSLAGLPLTLGAIGWFAGSWYQGRRPPEIPRYPLVRWGFGIVAAGVGALVCVTYAGVTPWLAIPCWAVGGAGMGIAMATVGVLVLELSPVERQGANSAALQIADAVGSTLAIGAGGAFFAATHATAWSTGAAIRVVFVTMALIAAVGYAVGGRVRPRA